MSRINSPLDAALRSATYNCLWSVVYAALNSGLDYSQDSKDQLERWRDLGAYFLAEVLITSARPDWNLRPNTFWMDPWIAQHLQRQEPDALTYIVDQWLEDRPLPFNVSSDPREEDSKVKHLKRLISALNP